jgi:hypothetical protein
MVNSDFVNPIEKLLDLQWCIPALGKIFNSWHCEALKCYIFHSIRVDAPYSLANHYSR